MTATAVPAPARTYHVVTAVWGPAFIDLFLRVCVPNQLSPGNLAALPAGSRYRIFTRASDVPALAASAQLDAVRAVMPVDIVDMDDAALARATGGQDRYKLMTACHRRAAADAADAEAALVFLAPDFVLAEGTLATLARLHSRGARAILTNNLRLKRSEFIAALQAAGSPAAMAPRDLVRLALGYLHPSIESLMVDGSSANDFPTAVCWPIRSASGSLEGIVARSLHLHPLLLDPVRRDVLPRHTIDGHYVMECCPDPALCHVVQDSDDLVAFELTPADTAVGTSATGRGVSRLRLSAMAAACNPLQRSHFEQPIRLHAGALDERWTPVEAASDVFARELDRYRPAGRLLLTVYRGQKILRRRSAARARAVRRTWRDSIRAVRRNARPLRRAVAARVSVVSRSARLAYHRAAKTARLQLKRLRRHVRLFRPA